MAKPNTVHHITFGRKLDKQIARWNGCKFPQAMSERTKKRILAQRAIVSMPRRPGEDIGPFVNRIANKVEMDPVDVEIFLFGGLRKPKNYETA